MSGFETFANVTDGVPGTAPNLFFCSTTDNLATISAAGYLNDKKTFIKANDIFWINYSDVTNGYPLRTTMAAVLGQFIVVYNPSTANYTLQQLAFQNGLSILGANGVHSALFTNAGGSATTVVTDARIGSTNKVFARWKSSANATIVQKVTPANGSFTVLSSTDPGASVLEYIAITPSTLLVNSGVEATRFAYVGGSATFTVTDASVTAASVINGNFSSSVTAVSVQKITPGAGTFTVLCSADPGVSVFDYTSVIPSVALTASGLYAAQGANAGGSATTAITDANILSTSIVTANWASSANAVSINKVTATGGTLTILSSGDPGASVLSYIATPVAE